MEHENYLVFDIETCPLPWDSFSESQQEYLLRGAVTEEEITKKKNEMGLTPLTAQVVCIGLMFMKPKEGGGFEMYKKAAFSVDNSITDDSQTEDKLSTGDTIIMSSEKKALDNFWKIFKKYNNLHLISFNGRNFDAPFLMLRSAVLGLRPSKNLMDGTKFSYSHHTDLIDKLTFYSSSGYGATKRFNFDFYTRAFGVTSPKAEGLDGSKVAPYFADGRINEISEYCLRDVVATWELFEIWRETLKF